MNGIGYKVNSRLTKLNQKRMIENRTKSAGLLFGVCLIAAVYFLIAYSLFHTLWYHKLFALMSTSIFALSLQDLYFEHVEKKIKAALPKTTKKLAHYYTHFNGSIIPTLKEVEGRCPAEAANYMTKIRKALQSGKPLEEIASLKRTFPFVWFRMLASLLYMAKEKGPGAETRLQDGTMDAAAQNTIGRSLSKITNILSFINVQQGYNDAELKYIQIFLYLSPFLFILASDWINSKILIEMNMSDVYQGIRAQNLKAYIFFSANLSALFIHWMRKQQI